jgi:hypothetical protein
MTRMGARMDELTPNPTTRTAAPVPVGFGSPAAWRVSLSVGRDGARPGGLSPNHQIHIVPRAASSKPFSDRPWKPAGKVGQSNRPREAATWPLACRATWSTATSPRCVQREGKKETVRLLGIDTPEKPMTPRKAPPVPVASRGRGVPTPSSYSKASMCDLNTDIPPNSRPPRQIPPPPIAYVLPARTACFIQRRSSFADGLRLCLHGVFHSPNSTKFRHSRARSREAKSWALWGWCAAVDDSSQNQADHRLPKH